MEKMWTKLKKAMEAKGLTQGEVEKSLGLSNARISKWKRDPNSLGLVDLLRMAEFVELDVAYWLNDSAEEPSVAAGHCSDHESLIGAFEGLGLDLTEAVRRLSLAQPKELQTRASR